jgi:hypothetical protein
VAPEVKQKCFVIMPFSQTNEKHTEEYWTNHYDKFLQPLIETNKSLKAVRSEALRGDILRQIITDLVTAPVVVAELTDCNPNVFWELGIRQSFRHGTITIAEYGFKLPSNLGFKGTLFYHPDGNHIKNLEFTTSFNKAIDDCLNNPQFPDSQVLEAISGRGTLHQILMRDESLRRLDALISEIKHNTEVFGTIVDTCNTNINKRQEKKTKEVKYITSHLRHVSVEMLIVSRYIDADKAFYEAAEKYMDGLIEVDDRLSAWPNRPEPVEIWFLKYQKYYEPIVDKFKALVIEQKKVIETIL